MRSSRAFTLIEVLVAVAIGMVVMGLAIGAYQHSQRLIRHAEAVLRLHRSAGDIAEMWERDVTALMQNVACNTTTSYVGGAKRLVQFTGMCTIKSLFDKQIYDYPHDIDFGWSRWEWNAANHQITVAKTPPPHWIPWYPQNFRSALDGNAVPIAPVVAMRANPLRSYADLLTGQRSWINPKPPTGGNPVTTVTRNYDLLFLTGVDVDGVTRTYADIGNEMDLNAVGKYANDLLAKTATGSAKNYGTSAVWKTRVVPDPRRVLSEDVMDCSISLVRRDGTVVSDPGTGINHSIDGEAEDGGSLALSTLRPSIIRLSLTLMDRGTGLIQSFTFSARAP